MPSIDHIMFALVWLAVTSIALTSATNTNTVTFNPNYRVRGVVSRTRHERALKVDKIAKEKTKHSETFKKRSYASDFIDAESSDKEDDNGTGRSGDCDGARSVTSKLAKSRSGASSARSGKKGKGVSRASGRSGKKRKGDSGGRSGRGDCKSTKLNSGASVAKFSSGPDREYPPGLMVATSLDASKKGNKGEKGASSILGASAVGCAREGSQKSAKLGKGRTRTRGLKKSKGISGVGRSEDCVEGASFKSGNNSLKFAVAKSNNKAGKSLKASTGAGVSEPAREYPEPGYTGEPVVKGAKDAQVALPKASPKVSSGVAAPGEETAVLAARSSANCEEIANGVVPGGESLVQQYEVSADIAVDTTNTTMDQFLNNFREYLQKEVALDVAGCTSPGDAVPTKITGVVFQQPYDTKLGCQVTGALQSQPTDAFDLTDEQENTIPKKRAYERQAETGKFVLTEEYPVEDPTETYGQAGLSPATTQAELSPATTQAGLSPATTPGEAQAGSQSAAADSFVVTNEKNGCYHVLVVVDVYLTPGAKKQDTDLAKAALQNAISEANMDVILGISNGEVTRKFSTTKASAFMATDTTSGKKIGFSMGMLGIVLVSLAVLKVAFSRKRKAEARKTKLYADMGADLDDIPDDSTFVYPTEDELVGPEFGDLAFDEAHQSHQRKQHYGNVKPKGSAYILDDLQDGMSVETGSSYASNEQVAHPISYRKVATTPNHRKGCC